MKDRSDKSDERVQRLYAQDLSGVEGPQVEDQKRIKRQELLEGPRAGILADDGRLVGRGCPTRRSQYKRHV
jgi:hypothetical protein